MVSKKQLSKLDNLSLNITQSAFKFNSGA